MKESLSSSETSALTRATRRNIPEDGILRGCIVLFWNFSTYVPVYTASRCRKFSAHIWRHYILLKFQFLSTNLCGITSHKNIGAIMDSNLLFWNVSSYPPNCTASHFTIIAVFVRIMTQLLLAASSPEHLNITGGQAGSKAREMQSRQACPPIPTSNAGFKSQNKYLC
jgi:accessory gene regulator protein AgrB